MKNNNYNFVNQTSSQVDTLIHASRCGIISLWSDSLQQHAHFSVKQLRNSTLYINFVRTYCGQLVFTPVRVVTGILKAFYSDLCIRVYLLCHTKQVMNAKLLNIDQLCQYNVLYYGVILQCCTFHHQTQQRDELERNVHNIQGQLQNMDRIVNQLQRKADKQRKRPNQN